MAAIYLYNRIICASEIRIYRITFTEEDVYS
jgi:hypothetical protein